MLLIYRHIHTHIIVYVTFFLVTINRCHQLGKNFLTSKCSFYRGSKTLAACLKCSNAFWDWYVESLLLTYFCRFSACLRVTFIYLLFYLFIYYYLFFLYLYMGMVSKYHYLVYSVIFINC